MKKIVQNSFSKGLNMDLNPLSTPRDVLTDCLNGTVITYNGDEFSLQTDMGNSVVLVPGDDTENPNSLPHGFIPIGVKEFNNILYVVAHNPLTKESRVGSIPAPQRYLPMYNDKSENTISKTISGTNDTSIQELTKNLTTPGYINHGMNLLNSFLNRGDKYQIAIKIGDESSAVTANTILEKFINNYGNGGEGYFDLNYYSLDLDGNLTLLDVNITPDPVAFTSDIYYEPDPFNNVVGTTNGKSFVHTSDGAVIIVAILTPKSIKAFNFKLQGFNDVNGLKARVIFTPELIDEGGSAIRIKSIKLDITNTEFNAPTTKYYDYETYGTTEEVIIDELIDNISEGFTEGTVITVTCTPIDQFGRELVDMAKTKSYTVTSLLLGADAHNLFQYEVVGTTLTIKYNFLNTVTSITQTKIEFYDFWSGVSVISAADTLDINREATPTFTLSTANPKTTVFDENTRGGIPTSTLTLPTTGQRILGTHITSAPLRADHCYLVRIFGTDTNVDYSVFQLLYTLPIDIFMSNYGVIDNFGTINIMDGMLNKMLDVTYTGALFGGAPISQLSTTPSVEEDSSNYTRPGGTASEAYRLYGGPVFEEFNEIETASWKTGKFFRNVYDGLFYKESSLLSMGYHNLPESTMGDLSLVDGDTLSSTLFESGAKHYLNGGLVAPATSSQKSFQFNIKSNLKSVGSTITGNVTLLPTSSSLPLLFGPIDMSALNKRITLGDYTSELMTSLNKVCTISSSNITESLTWSTPPTVSDPTVKSSKVTVEVLSGEVDDTVSLKDFEINTQRFTYAPSAFKYYTRSFLRNKIFRYFTLSNTQTIKAKIIVYPTDYVDITKHIDYVFHGSSETEYDIQIVDNSGFAGATTKYNLVKSSPVFTATLNWIDDASLSLPVFIDTIGHSTWTLPVGATSVTVDNALHLSEKGLLFYSYAGYGNVNEQHVYKTYKSSKPVNFKLYTNNVGLHLSTYNNLWRWDDASTYVAMQNPISESYLNSLVLNQPYKEIILAQYPVAPFIYNTSGSVTSVALDTNDLKYYTKGNSIAEDKHLTKSCFNSATLSPFSVNAFINLIDGWKNTNLVGGKIVYDFTKIDLSEGYAKNIPWDYGDGLLRTVDMADITMQLQAPAQAAHLTLFTNSVASLLASTYMTNETGSPTIKGIQNNQLVPVVSNYFTTESVPATDNINKSAIFVPRLAKSTLNGRLIQFASPQYGITYKVASPPSLLDIINGANLQEGMEFGGGIIYKLYRGYGGTVSGGKIVAISDVLSQDRWSNFTIVPDCYPWWGTYVVGAYDSLNGFENTALMAASCQVSKFIIKHIKEYRDPVYGYADWYLPAVDEMKELVNSTAYAQGKFTLTTTNDYWTSTESTGLPEKAYMFKVNGPGNYHSQLVDKNNDRSARPIRKF